MDLSTACGSILAGMGNLFKHTQGSLHAAFHISLAHHPYINEILLKKTHIYEKDIQVKLQVIHYLYVSLQLNIKYSQTSL